MHPCLRERSVSRADAWNAGNWQIVVVVWHCGGCASSLIGKETSRRHMLALWLVAFLANLYIYVSWVRCSLSIKRYVRIDLNDNLFVIRLVVDPLSSSLDTTNSGESPVTWLAGGDIGDLFSPLGTAKQWRALIPSTLSAKRRVQT